MSIGHKIEENELINIFNQFVGSIIDGPLDGELTEYFHRAVCEVATGYPYRVKKGDFSNLINDFIDIFDFDDVNGGYQFEFENLSFKGSTTIIDTERKS